MSPFFRGWFACLRRLIPAHVRLLLQINHGGPRLAYPADGLFHAHAKVDQNHRSEAAGSHQPTAAMDENSLLILQAAPDFFGQTRHDTGDPGLRSLRIGCGQVVPVDPFRLDRGAEIRHVEFNEFSGFQQGNQMAGAPCLDAFEITLQGRSVQAVALLARADREAEQSAARGKLGDSQGFGFTHATYHHGSLLKGRKSAPSRQRGAKADAASSFPLGVALGAQHGGQRLRVFQLPQHLGLAANDREVAGRQGGKRRQ